MTLVKAKKKERKKERLHQLILLSIQDSWSLRSKGERKERKKKDKKKYYKSV